MVEYIPVVQLTGYVISMRRERACQSRLVLSNFSQHVSLGSNVGKNTLSVCSLCERHSIEH